MGYLQQQCVDFDETYSPVVRFETVGVFLALASQFQLSDHQFDVKSSFPNCDLQEEGYVSKPEGFVQSNGFTRS